MAHARRLTRRGWSEADFDALAEVEEEVAEIRGRYGAAVARAEARNPHDRDD